MTTSRTRPPHGVPAAGSTVPFAMALAFLASPLAAQEPAPPPGFAAVDHDIGIGVLPGRLRYDKERFAVRPGSKVKLTLTNTDEMQHNLLICRPGSTVLEKVAAAALALGGEASAKHFVPDLPEVLFHTRAPMPGERDTIWFQAPEQAGVYPYICTLPGHTFTMRGEMVVGDAGAAGLLTGLRYELFRGSFKRLAELDGRQPDRRGAVNGELIDIGDLGSRNDFGVWYHASLQVPRGGTHNVYLSCDDGARVRIDGTTVVEHDGIHGAGPERKGQIGLGAGRHELWVEFFQAGGGMVLQLAIEGPGLPRRSLTVEKGRRLPEGIPITVLAEPVVMRVHVEQGPARGIAVGLPGGMNCLFDAQRCQVQSAWAGAFLDVGPDRLDRGGQPCKILGRRFDVGGDEFVMHLDGKPLPVVFRGYHTGPEPRFEFDWGGRPVTWAVRAAPGAAGLQYDIAIQGLEPPDQVALRFGSVPVSCTAGTVADGWLRLSGVEGRSFTVTVGRTEGGDR